VAEAVFDSPCLQLAGVEGYEGAVPGDSFEHRIAAVPEYMKQVRMVAEHLDALGAFAGLDEVVISVGGSIFVDVVARELCGAWHLKRPVRIVLRAGSYAFHDTDLMEQQGALGGRNGGSDRLRPALELWATVLSRPEPTRVIVGFGKRDVSYDISLPVPFGWSRDGEIIGFEGEASVTVLNDQHAFVSVDPDCEIDVGDVVGFAVSHPCTALDKWKMLPVVDDDYIVTGAIATYF
jgi:D-serine dehydratase